MVSWFSRKKTFGSTSACEANYIGLSHFCHESVWLKRLFVKLLFLVREPCRITLFRDNNGSISLSLNESINRWNKHINITFHFVGDVVARNEAHLEYQPMAEVIYDIMTKSLGKVQHQMCIIGMVLGSLADCETK